MVLPSTSNAMKILEERFGKTDDSQVSPENVEG